MVQARKPSDAEWRSRHTSWVRPGLNAWAARRVDRQIAAEDERLRAKRDN